MTYGFSETIQNSYGTSYSGTTNLISNFRKTSNGSIEVDLTQHLLKDFWIDRTRLTIRLEKNKLKSSEQAVRQQLIHLGVMGVFPSFLQQPEQSLQRRGVVADVADHAVQCLQNSGGVRS